MLLCGSKLAAMHLVEGEKRVSGEALDIHARSCKSRQDAPGQVNGAVMRGDFRLDLAQLTSPRPALPRSGPGRKQVAAGAAGEHTVFCGDWLHQGL